MCSGFVMLNTFYTSYPLLSLNWFYTIIALIMSSQKQLSISLSCCKHSFSICKTGIYVRDLHVINKLYGTVTRVTNIYHRSHLQAVLYSWTPFELLYTAILGLCMLLLMHNTQCMHAATCMIPIPISFNKMFLLMYIYRMSGVLWWQHHLRDMLMLWDYWLRLRLRSTYRTRYATSTTYCKTNQVHVYVNGKLTFHSQNGVTALHIAAEEGKVDVARLLIEAKAHVNKKSKVATYILI